MKKIAVMQPYLFPYIGYFQLIMSSDVFVIYDDVNFIKSGYINRNNIIVRGGVYRFTVPVINGSSNSLIKDVFFQGDFKKILATFQHAYSKSSFFKFFFPVIEDIFSFDKRDVPSLCKYSYQKIFDYLEIKRDVVFSSEIEYDRNQTADKKLVSICKALGGDVYINSPGGRSLYKSSMFNPYGIELLFINPSIESYSQIGTAKFFPYLSVIDILMNVSKDEFCSLVSKYELEN